MQKAWDFIKKAVNAYVDFLEDWPGVVAILWPVTVVLAIWFV